MNGDPYNTVAPTPHHFGHYEPVDTVRFTHQLEVLPRHDVPGPVRRWAQSNLPDGEYIAQYQMCSDNWRFGRIEFTAGKRKIHEIWQTYP